MSEQINQQPESTARGVISRTQKPNNYPERFPVPDDRADWAVDFPEYDPPEYDAPRANSPKAKEGDYADPEDARLVDWQERRTFSDPGWHQFYDEASGRPINPICRTGLRGRGKLNAWGATLAADPVVTRPATNEGIELLVIARADNGKRALPGGKLKVNAHNEVIETAASAAQRELKEEAGASLDFSSAATVYSGYADDERNTDNAWMETTALHIHLGVEEGRHLKIGETEEHDAEFPEWVRIEDALLETLTANHGQIVKLAVERLSRQQ